MSMRQFECNICGEPLSAENDEELLGRLRRHVESEHGADAFNEDEARSAIADQAYTASDN